VPEHTHGAPERPPLEELVGGFAEWPELGSDLARYALHLEERRREDAERIAELEDGIAKWQSDFDGLELEFRAACERITALEAERDRLRAALRNVAVFRDGKRCWCEYRTATGPHDGQCRAASDVLTPTTEAPDA
jgi:hypothetical protein